MTNSGAVPGFAPSTNGFRFTNSFPPAPTVKIDLGPVGTVGLGNASQGVCGGMAFAVRDYFEVAQTIPADLQPPPAGSPLFTYITARLIDSFDVPTGVARYAEWMLAPSADLNLLVDTRAGTFSRTVNSTWPKLRATIDGGRPCPLGLVTVHTADLSQIGKCHQVLAYAYSCDDAGLVTVRVYDPNTAHGSADDVWITFNSSAPKVVSPINHNINIGEPTLHGFFCSAYSRKQPPG
jgi:hypothetical protein